eukprot:3863925-Prymnesium_polylepis.1
MAAARDPHGLCSAEAAAASPPPPAAARKRSMSFSGGGANRAQPATSMPDACTPGRGDSEELWLADDSSSSPRSGRVFGRVRAATFGGGDSGGANLWVQLQGATSSAIERCG